MLNQDFFNFLEYHLTNAFSYSTDIIVRSLWCDGILLPSNENHYSKKVVNDNREVMVKAFIGKGGQDEYSMLLKFGRKSLSRYAKDQDMRDCVPEAEKNDWYVIDPKTNKIIIQLL